MRGVGRLTLLLPPGRIDASSCLARFDLIHAEGPYDPTPTWRILRVDVPDLSYAGATAIRMARRLNMNVIVPGMHRTVLIGETSGVLGSRRTLWGLEMGSAKGKQASFVVIGPDDTVKPQIVFVDTDDRMRSVPRRWAA